MEAVPASKAPARPQAVSSCCFARAGGGPEEARAAADAPPPPPPPPPRAGPAPAPPAAAAAAAPTAITLCTIPSALSPLASITTAADFLSEETTSTVPAEEEGEGEEEEEEEEEEAEAPSVSSARTSQLGLVARALEHPTRARNSRAGLASGEAGEKRTTIFERPASEVMVVGFFFFRLFRGRGRSAAFFFLDRKNTDFSFPLPRFSVAQSERRGTRESALGYARVSDRKINSDLSQRGGCEKFEVVWNSVFFF